MRMKIRMSVSKTTKRTTVFSAVQTVYVNTESLRSQGCEGKNIILTVSDESDDEAEGGEIHSDDDVAAFEEFLGTSITECARSRLTTGDIWNVWAARYDASPTDDVIAGIRRRDVGRVFRAYFSVPPAERGRVDGRVQYHWKGYAVVHGNDEE